MHDIAAIKERLFVPDAWRILNCRGTPDKNPCHAPHREDRRASFSIYDDGRKWKDQSTDEHGDVIDFVQLVCEVDRAEAIRRCADMAGQALPPPIEDTRRHSRTKADGLRLPPVTTGTAEQHEAVARSRRLNPIAVSLAVHGLKTVVFGRVCESDCWILTDHVRKIAEARRIDGNPFPAFKGLSERKAHTIAGSSKSWPCGLGVLTANPLYQFGCIALVEGGPDFLAALHFAVMQQRRDILPVAILGRNASSSIAPEALAALKGRRVRIYAHADKDGGGLNSAAVWGQQLREVDCTVDAFDFRGLTRKDGKPVKDLNDAAVIAPDQQPELENLFPCPAVAA